MAAEINEELVYVRLRVVLVCIRICMRVCIFVFIQGVLPQICDFECS